MYGYKPFNTNKCQVKCKNGNQKDEVAFHLVSATFRPFVTNLPRYKN